MNEYLDNTIISSYKDCPRRYFIRHQLDWRRTGVALPLVFGLSWHSAMDIVWQYAKEVPQDDLPKLALAKFCETWESEGLPVEMSVDEVAAYGARTPSVAHEMLINYINTRWQILQSCKLIACEQPFAVPMPGLENVWYIGRLDKVITHAGENLVIEHKTTSEYKIDGGFQSLYIEGWYNDSQVKGYQFGGGMFFDAATQVWVDAALVHKKVHNAFRFVPVAHQRPLLNEWIDDTREWIKLIQHDVSVYKNAGSKLTPGNFKRNENACLGKYGACQFLNICRSVSDPSTLKECPEGYQIEKWAPFELLGMDKIIQGENNDTKI